MANVTVSVTETALNVSTTLSNIIVTDSDGGQKFNVTSVTSVIDVTAPVTNVIVSETAGVSPAEVRGYLSATTPITYNANTGVIGIDSSALFTGKTTDDLAQGSVNKYFSNTLARAAISGAAPILYNASTGVVSIDSAAIDIANANVTLKEFHETVYDNGNISGNVTFDLRNGTIHKARLVANVTNITFANVTAGSGITLLLQQDTIGNWVVNTTNLTNWEFAGNIRVIDNSPSSNSMIAVVYDGAKYKSSWIKFDEEAAVNLSNNNTDQLPEGSTNKYFSNTLARAAISVTDTGGDGSLTYSSGNGVITYVGPSQSDANARISAAPQQVRQHFTGVSPITYDSSTGFIGLSSSANITTTGNIQGGNLIATRGVVATTVTASGNVTGSFFIGNGSLLTGVTSLTNAQVVSYISTQPLTVGGNLTVNGNINATGNINVQNVTDLYVRDQIIVLNANAATNSNVEIISYRPTATNTSLKWNEQAGRWEFTNNGTTYLPIPASTTNLAEGANLYFTTDRANSAIGAYQGAINTAANITTSGNIQGSYILGNGSFLTGLTIGAQSNASNQNFDVAYVGGDGKVYYDSSAEFRFNPATNTLSIGPGGSFQLSGGNALIGNLDVTGLTTGVNASYTGRVVAGYFDGDGSNLDNITTTIVAEGTRLYYTTDRANTAIDTRVNKAFVEGLGVSYTSLTNKPTIPTHTSNLINDSGYITTANANVISVNGKTGVVSLTTTDIPEGANLYFTTDRANSAIGAYQGSISTAGNISTTGNLSVGNIVNVTNIEGTGPFATIAMNSINPKEIILGQNFGSKIFFPYNGQSLVGQGQYLRVDSVNGSGSTLALKNFGLSYGSIGTFGNVAAGDPANISYTQTASVVRAGLSGDVNDINVSGVASGDTGWIVIYQHAGSGRQLRLGPSWKMEGCTTGNPVNIAQAQDEETLIFWTYDGTNYRGTVTPNIGSNVSVDIRTTGNIVGGNANITNAVNATTVNTTNVNGTTVTATTANATTVNSTTVNATTLVATTANATTVNGTTVNGTTVNANTIATTAASNTVSVNANVNANGNIVANAALVTVTNGNNISLNNERNLGLLIDRNNNSANVTVTTLSGTNYRGSDNPDRLVFSSQVEGLSDGQPVTISGFTNATVAGALNGNVFYLRQNPGNPVRYSLFSDAAMTVGVNLGVTNINAGPGAITFTRRNFVTPKEWSLNVDQLSNDLRIKEDGTTRVTVASGGNVNITGTANANSIVISQPGTAGTYANTRTPDNPSGIIPGSTAGLDPNIVLVSIYNSGQTFPMGNIFQLTFSGVTGPGNVNLNGQTFWTDGVDILGYGDTIQLFTNSAATTPANSQVLGITSQTGGGTLSFNFTPGTAGNNWQLSSVNGNLNIAHNGTVVGNVNSAGNLTITGRHTYDRVYGEFYYSANINPAAADTIYSFPLDTTTISSDVIANNTSRINITKPGIFKIFASIQIKNSDNSADHLMRFWLRKNGVDVPASATVITPLKLQEQVVSMHWMVDSDGDDYWEIVYYVNNTGVAFPNYPAITSPVTAPQAPPIIVNVLPVGA